MTDKGRFDLNQAEYLHPTPDRKVDQKVLDLVSDYVISRLSGDRILELGVGDQVWTPKLLNKCGEVVTVDGSAALLAAMKRKVPEHRWKPVLSLFEEYEPGSRFDTVVATYIIEHVDDPALIFSLARRKWLKDGGKLVVVVPHALSLHRRLAVKMGLAAYPGELGDTDRRMEHKWCFTYSAMEELIVKAGFKILEEKGMFTKLLPNSMLVQCSDAQLRGMFELGLELPIEYSAAIYFLAEAQAGEPS
jgi:2-polyprenyl-3-methyl-5-hydroxy-6-metoxy-1,4-benzoquinol methylase